MWYVAFTIGLFGSLHCIGMCGPLAIAFCNKEGNSKTDNIKSALAYNLGRTTTYGILGILFGLIGTFLFVADLQKTISIILGALLVLSFFLSINIDHTINKHRYIKNLHRSIRKLISDMLVSTKNYNPFLLGMANGLLPCGLVYLALAGAVATGNIAGGILFMILFGLGTLPALFILTTGIGLLTTPIRNRIKVILPYVSLSFGIFLIYRGIVIVMPDEMNFWEAILNPVMCH